MGRAAGSSPGRWGLVLTVSVLLACYGAAVLFFVLPEIVPPQWVALGELPARDCAELHRWPEARREATLVFVPIQRIPGHLIAALLEQEDRAFRRHHGVDWSQAMRALRRDVAAGAYHYGASTITMQLVRELFLGKQRTLFRKAREIAYALQVERRLGKDEILELYLNLVHWGPSVRGVGAASCYYYGVAPADLEAGQAAGLVSVLTSPERLGPELLDRNRARTTAPTRSAADR